MWLGTTVLDNADLSWKISINKLPWSSKTRFSVTRHSSSSHHPALKLADFVTYVKNGKTFGILLVSNQYRQISFSPTPLQTLQLFCQSRFFYFHFLRIPLPIAREAYIINFGCRQLFGALLGDLNHVIQPLLCLQLELLF